MIKKEPPKKVDPESEFVESLLAETELAKANLEKEDAQKKAAIAAKDIEKFNEIKKKHFEIFQIFVFIIFFKQKYAFGVQICQLDQGFF